MMIRHRGRSHFLRGRIVTSLIYDHYVDLDSHKWLIIMHLVVVIMILCLGLNISVLSVDFNSHLSLKDVFTLGL